MGKAIQFLDAKIDAINDELKDIRENALLKIGKNTASAGLARTQLTREMSSAKENFAKSLMEYKTKIRMDRRIDKRIERKSNDQKNHSQKKYKLY